MLKYKSVYDPIRKGDGIRILATRFRGRGMHKSRYSVWMPNLGPSEEILKAISADKMSWPTFKKKYMKEIWGVADILDKKDLTIKNHGQKFTLRLIRHLAKIGDVTLMCHCDAQEKQCHLRALAELMKSKNI